MNAGAAGSPGLPARFQDSRPWVGRNLDEAAKRAVKDVLGVGKQERVLIVTHPDPEMSRIALAVHDAVVATGGDPVLISTQPRRGAELADPVLLKALESDPQVLVLLTTGRIGGDPDRLARPIHGTYTHYLQYLLAEAPTRGFWAHMVSRNAFIKGLSVRPQDLKARVQELSTLLEETVEVRIATGKGTELVVPVDGTKVRTETGDYRSPGAMGEIPAGEVVIPVRKSLAAGRLRVAGGLGLPEEALTVRSPVEVEVQEGRLVKVTGGPEARSLEDAMADAERIADQAVREGWLTRDEAGSFATSAHEVKELAFGVNPGLKARGDPRLDAKAHGVLRVVVGAGLREYPPGAPVCLELLVTGAQIRVVGPDGKESPLLGSGGLLAPKAGH